MYTEEQWEEYSIYYGWTPNEMECEKEMLGNRLERSRVKQLLGKRLERNFDLWEEHWEEYSNYFYYHGWTRNEMEYEKQLLGNRLERRRVKLFEEQCFDIIS